ncbi:uncharacterized protein [Linepithema humile]|uniref:uncharacterized protein n=1 Tax=Linepithema humile TaxID=83485 RepID=UPI00351F6F94
MLKNWLKSTENRRQKLENEDDVDEISSESGEIEINSHCSESTIYSSSRASSFSRAKRFKASLCFGSTSDNDNQELDNSKENSECNTSKQKRKDKKTNGTFRTKSDA